MTRRLEAMGQADYTGLTTDKHFNGKMRCLPHKLGIPLKWKKPRRVFVNSMSDLFHEDVPDEFIDQVFAVMYQAQWHAYQVLTKRAERMHRYMTTPGRAVAIGTAAFKLASEMDPAKASILTNADFVDDVLAGWPLRQVWLGISAEDQARLKARLPWLLKTPSAVRFVSAEPLLEPLSFFDAGMKIDGKLDPETGLRNFIHWVIDGCESGPGRREYREEWSRAIQDQCKAAGVAYFRKQMIVNGKV